MANQEETGRLLKQLEQQFVAIGQTIGEMAAHLDQPPAVAYVRRFLNEPQMAEHLGITKRAIQHRRLRGQIPPSVMQKVGPDWIYSVDRYEDWLDSKWPSPSRGLAAEARKQVNRSDRGTKAIITRLV